jgi:signal transduction histidine kinase
MRSGVETDDSVDVHQVESMARRLSESSRAEEKYRRMSGTLRDELRARTEEIEQQSGQLQDLSSRLLQAQDEERRRLAHELHDSAGQILTLLSISLAQAAKHAPRKPEIFGQITRECEVLVQQLSQEIRTMSYLLHPPMLDELGLLKGIRSYIEGLAKRSGLVIALVAPAAFERLSPEMELTMFRLVQECLTNIHRHSGSRNAVIRIARDCENISLEVQDAGKGMSREKLREIQSQGSGVGIRGMRERLRPFRGQMRVESNHRGTTISFEFPFAGHAAQRPQVLVPAAIHCQAS